MSSIESRPLRYFVAVARELSFARAAEQLGIAAPAVSRAIAQLERQLGVRLFERTTRRVALTPAGQVLLEEAQVALDCLEAAAQRARRAAGPGHRLVLALKPDLDGGLLEPTMVAYAREQSTMPLELCLCGWGEQTRLLLEGRADVALVPAPFDRTDLDFDVLLEEPQLLAVAAGHEFASRDVLRVRDVDDVLRRRTDGELWEPRGGHLIPRVPQRIDGLPELLKLIELGQLAALLPTSVADRYPRPGIAYRHLADAPPAVLAVAWPRGSRSVAVAAFVRVAADVAAARSSPKTSTACAAVRPAAADGPVALSPVSG